MYLGDDFHQDNIQCVYYDIKKLVVTLHVQEVAEVYYVMDIPVLYIKFLVAF